MILLSILAGITFTPLWRPLDPIPDPEGFAGMFAGPSHGALLALGGSNFPEKKPWEGGNKVWSDKVYVLESAKGKWRMVGHLPKPLGYGVYGSYQNKVICAGGNDARGCYSDCFSAEWLKGRLVFRSLPPLPTASANCSGTLIGSRLYVVGGQESPDSVVASRAIYCLDVSHPERGWKHLTDLATGRILCGVASYGGHLIIFGGASLSASRDGKVIRKYLADSWELTEDGTLMEFGPLPFPVVAPPNPAPVVGEAITVLGGDDGSQVGIDPKAHQGFRRETIVTSSPIGNWFVGGSRTFAQVTCPCVSWNGRWVVIGGEIRPGIRTNKVWIQSNP